MIGLIVLLALLTLAGFFAGCYVGAVSALRWAAVAREGRL